VKTKDFRAMRTYTVHEPPNRAAGRLERAETLVFVRDGFSLIAALLTPFWLIAHRLWLPLVGYLGLVAIIEIAASTTGAGSQIAGWVTLAVHLLIGLEGDTIQRWALERRGFETVGSVSGRTADECERRFFESWLSEQPFVSAGAFHSPPGSHGGGGSSGRLSAAALWPGRV
jgi:uncharacterized membrane protein YgcG